MLKVSGLEFKQFLNDPKFWVDHQTWYEFDSFYVNDTDRTDDDVDHDELLPTDVIKIEAGTVHLTDSDTEGVSLNSYFKKWKKLQTEGYVLVKLKKKDIEPFKLHVKTFKNASVVS